MKPMFSIKTAGGAAWRGLYFYVRDRMFGRIVLDPAYEGPKLKLAIPYGWYRSCANLIYPRLWEISIPLPYVRWKNNASRFRLWCYKRSSWFWHKMDGRYGWFNSVKNLQKARK